LKNMPPQQIVGHLQHVLQQEMVPFEEPALWLLGRAADGSMRDALSLTDQAIAFGSGQVNEEEIRTMLGSIDLSYVYQLLEAVAANDPPLVLQIIAKMAEHAPDFEGSVVELISMIHRVTVAQIVPQAIDNSWGDAERVAQIASSISAEDAQLYYQLAINGKRDMAFAADPRSGFEMILLRMIAFRPTAVLDESLTPEDIQPAKLAQQNNVALEVDSPVKKPREAPPVAPVVVTEKPVLESLHAEAAPASVDIVAPEPTVLETDGVSFALEQLQSSTWADLLETLGLHGIVYNIASHCELLSRSGSTLEFVLDERHGSLFNDKHRVRIAAVLESHFGTTLTVNVELGVPRSETPAMRAIRLKEERQREAVASIEGDPVLQQLIERFDGQLVQSSIGPIEP
jgi:DNA polymerase-3 subunit gamma/tau